jgi:hypothetical protein
MVKIGKILGASFPDNYNTVAEQARMEKIANALMVLE